MRSRADVPIPVSVDWVSGAEVPEAEIPEPTEAMLDAAEEAWRLNSGRCSWRDLLAETYCTMRRADFARWDVPWSQHRHYELDHWIPLDLGGADTPANRRPQRCDRWEGYRFVAGRAFEKDKVEAAAARQVCVAYRANGSDLVKTHGSSFSRTGRSGDVPTGFTSDVADGKIIDFRDFAWKCARGIDALVMMRDDPMDAPIHQSFKPSPYHKDHLQEIEEQLLELRTLTPEQAELRALRDYEETARTHRRYNEENDIRRTRYEDMLNKVRAWEPPSPDHTGMKSFMIEQLERSIKFDCSHHWDDPERLSGTEWLAQRIAKAEKDIEYHREKWEDEVERIASRNCWIAQLRESLG